MAPPDQRLNAAQASPPTQSSADFSLNQSLNESAQTETLSSGLVGQAVLQNGQLESNPEVIDAARQEQIQRNQNLYHHHHPSLAQQIAHEHDVLRAAGRESAQALVPPVMQRNARTSPGIDTGAAQVHQLSEQILSFLSTCTKKNKAVVTDDAELAEFMRQHPELSQYIRQLQEAREQALRSAQDSQDPLQSRDNLIAKLDVIATLLEGSPLAPALRMGDTAARDSLIAAATTEMGEDGALLAEYTWQRARELSIKNYEAEGTAIATLRAQQLADPDSYSPGDREALNTRQQAYEASLATQFGPDSAITEYLLTSMRQAEDLERSRLVSQEVWKLQVRARVLEGRMGEESARRTLEEYLSSQADLFSRHPQLRAQIDSHMIAAVDEGRKLREHCDFAARELFRACDGCGTYENVIFRTLEGRSQAELKIIRERYQEMYGEHLRDRLYSELSGSDWQRAERAYNGTDYQGNEPRAVGHEQLRSSIGLLEAATTHRALASGDRAQEAVILVHHVIEASPAPAAEILRIIEIAEVSPASFADAQAELGLGSALDALRARANTTSRDGQPTLAAQRDHCGLQIVESVMAGSPVADELLAQYAALEGAEYGRQLGLAEGRERPSVELVTRLNADHDRFSHATEPLFERYPGLSEKVQQSVEDYRCFARSSMIESIADDYGERIGLLYGGDDNPAVRQKRDDLSRRLDNYLRAQHEFVQLQPDLSQRIDDARTHGIQRGIESMESVRRAVSQLNSGMSGWGTAEARCYAALQNKTANELRLIKELYQERFGTTIENHVENDFSDAELDKMHALLVLDRIGVLAADADIAMTGFWGVDQEALRATLRQLSTTQERAEFKERFDSRYLDHHFSVPQSESEPVVQAESFEQALTFRMSGDNLIAAQSLFEGNFHRADAALVHLDMQGLFGLHGEDAAQRLEEMRLANGHLDMQRIGSIEAEFNQLYEAPLREQAARIDGADGRWLGSVVEGNEVDAAVHKLRFAMGGSMDGTDERLVREPFSVPEELAARAREEDRRGERSAETQHALDEWAQFRETVVSRYSQADMYPGRDVLVDLRDELNDHHFRMVKTLINDGRLSRADLIADACVGLGTDEDTVREETANLSKEEVRQLYLDFQQSGYGRLDVILRSELSGDEEFDVMENLFGRPETAQEMLVRAERRIRHEDSGLLSFVVWGNEREEMHADLQRLRAAVSGSGDAHEIDALYRRFGVSASAFRDQKNEVTDIIVNTGTTVIMIGGTVVIIAGSGGTATPGAVALWSVYLAGTAGVVRVGSKWAIRGDGYGNEELAVDGGIMLVDMAAAGMMSKVPVGNAVAGRLEVMLGEIAAQRGAVVLADDGARLTGDALFRYLAQSNRGIRIVVGATQGSIDGAIFAPIQASGITALQEQTWKDGFGTGLQRMGEAGLQAVPVGMVTGGVVSGAAAIRTPLHIRNGQPVSMDRVADLRSSGRLSDAGQQLLSQREAMKGFVTRGDVADAMVAGTMIGNPRSQELIQLMRENVSGAFSEGDIRLYEARVRNEGSLSRLDEYTITGENPNRYVAAMSQRQLEKRIVATRQEIQGLQVQAQAPGLSQNQLESIQNSLSLAQDRLFGLEEVMRLSSAAQDSIAQPGIIEQVLPAPSEQQPAVRRSEVSEAVPGDSPGTSSRDADLPPELLEQRELVSRLERDLVQHADNSKFRTVIEESLAEQRARLQRMQSELELTAPTGDSDGYRPSSDTSDDSNPWAYDPSESFARELEAQQRGDFDEPLDSGWRRDEPWRGDSPPGGSHPGDGGVQMQRAPQRQRTRVMVAELPEPAPQPGIQNRAVDDIGVQASRADVELGQQIIDDAIADAVPHVSPRVRPLSAPAQEMGAPLNASEEALVRQMLDDVVVLPQTAPQTSPSPAPSIEEILQPQFTDPVIQTVTEPIVAPQRAPTPAPLLSRVLNPRVRVMTETVTDYSEALQRRNEPAQPRTQPKLEVHEAVTRKVAQRVRGDGSGAGESGTEEMLKRKEKERLAQEDKKRKIEHEKSEPKGGGKLKFVKVRDALGDDNLMVENEERAESGE